MKSYGADADGEDFVGGSAMEELEADVAWGCDATAFDVCFRHDWNFIMSSRVKSGRQIDFGLIQWPMSE